MNLALSDALTGCYLFTLGIADVVMEGNFVLYDIMWKESSMCISMACIQTFSMEMSLMSQVGLSTLQMLAIVWHRNPSIRYTSLAIFFGWLSLFAITLSQAIFANHFNLDICLFNVMSLQFPMMVYNIFWHLVLNTILLTLSCLFCGKMIHKIHSTTQLVKQFGCQNSKSSPHTFILLIVQTSCRVISCLPIQILLLAAFYGLKVSADLVSWTMVASMSFNALINPFLYTLRTIFKKKWSRHENQRETRSV